MCPLNGATHLGNSPNEASHPLLRGGSLLDLETHTASPRFSRRIPTASAARPPDAPALSYPLARESPALSPARGCREPGAALGPPARLWANTGHSTCPRHPPAVSAFPDPAHRAPRCATGRPGAARWHEAMRRLAAPQPARRGRAWVLPAVAAAVGFSTGRPLTLSVCVNPATISIWIPSERPVWISRRSNFWGATSTST